MRRDWEVQRGPSGPLSGPGSFARRRGWGSFGPAGHLSAKITVLMLEVDGEYSFLPGSISSPRCEGKEARYVLSVRQFCWICEKGHTTQLITRRVSHAALLSLINPPCPWCLGWPSCHLIWSTVHILQPNPTQPEAWQTARPEISLLVVKLTGLKVLVCRN